jgi:tRNA U34 5-carboxymethylaminomethyl modifying GTPase MnmE/TrmE
MQRKIGIWLSHNLFTGEADTERICHGEKSVKDLVIGPLLRCGVLLAEPIHGTRATKKGQEPETA